MNSKRNYNFQTYDPSWPLKFNEIKQTLTKVFGMKASNIEHVGSTSIPGMDAKPLIDILVVVEDIKNLEDEKVSMISMGYNVRENILNNRSILFEMKEVDEKVQNIHVFEKDARTIGQFTYTRDYLRTHPERAEEYMRLKHMLKEKFPNDYEAYRDGKHDFLQETERLAREWVGESL